MAGDRNDGNGCCWKLGIVPDDDSWHHGLRVRDLGVLRAHSTDSFTIRKWHHGALDPQNCMEKAGSVARPTFRILVYSGEGAEWTPNLKLLLDSSKTQRHMLKQDIFNAFVPFLCVVTYPDCFSDLLQERHVQT